MTLAEQLAVLRAAGVTRARFEGGALVEVEMLPGLPGPAAHGHAGPPSTREMLDYFGGAQDARG